MTVKEVEKTVGMTGANIRFYEKEHLISPGRNQSNNYREYTQEDIVRLKKIKLLRVLGVSVADIRKMIEKPEVLEQIMNERITAVHNEKEKLNEIEEICGYIVKQKMNFQTLNEEILDEKADAGIIKEKLSYALKADTSEEEISRDRFNRQIMLMLMYSFLFSAVVSIAFRNFFGFSIQQKETMLFLLVSLGAAFMTYMSAKPVVQCVVFQAVTCIIAPVSILLTRVKFREFIWVFFVMLAVYALCIGLLAVKNETYILKFRYMAGTALVFTAAETLCMYILTGSFKGSLAVAGICSCYIAFGWVSVNKKVDSFNKYYAVVSAMRILNVPAFLISLQGTYSMGNWRRDGRTFK